MHIRTVTAYEDFVALKPEWDRLYIEVGPRHPFLAFEWAKAWWDTMLSPSRLQKHSLHILVAEDRGAVKAVVPMFLTTYLGWLAGGLRYLRPIGSDLNLTELKCVLCPEALEGPLATALKNYFAAQCRTWDFLRWPDMTVAAAEALGWTDKTCVSNFIVALGPDWETFKSTRKRNIKEGIRKCYNAPLRAGVELELRVVRDRGAILALVPEFYRLHAARADQSGTTAHPNYYLKEMHRIFLERLVATLSPAEPRLYVLRHGERIVCARFGFVANKTLYLYYSGTDPEYTRFSAMTRLVVEAMKLASEEGITGVNLSTGSDTSKTRWSPDEVTYFTAKEFSANAKAKLIAPLVQRLNRKLEEVHLHSLHLKQPMPVAGE